MANEKFKINGVVSEVVPTIGTTGDILKKTGSGVEWGSLSKSDVGLGAVNNVAITAAQVTKINELNYTKVMTQAQYDALSTEEKNRTDVWYGIYEE